MIISISSSAAKYWIRYVLSAFFIYTSVQRTSGPTTNEKRSRYKAVIQSFLGFSDFQISGESL